ncbi:acyl-[acyl-carrier-protein] thioesterase [Lactobacillus psittaci]|uniref:Acyl-ACP thioesterase n=1 Tax=Lactobacillus psittaci DSM 15354 TaxID=1122152 RepID=A0A0R1S383_9LACO|nr:acyl-ACP thioesterase domain-containing protein [Lactobacillus psittaci]KRL63097.1 acyl-ACP thioesterase [Lactobacillus psittaci DSM 15354]
MEYQEKYQIQYADCDETGTIKLQNLVDAFMHVSNRQLEHTKASSKAMNSANLGWVVTQYQMDIQRLPQVGEVVTLVTKPTGYNRFFEYRDFYLRFNGQELVKIQSQWVILDLEKRKIVPPDSELMASFESPLLAHNPRLPRIKVRDSYDKKRSYHVRYDDLDLNHHMTNSHYFSWMLDMLEREYLNQHELTKVDIKFSHEVLYGQDVRSECELDGDTSYHLISQNGQSSAIAEFGWRKRQDEEQ